MSDSRSQPLVLSAAESREVDRIAIEKYGMLGLVLMENAGRAAAEHLMRRLERRPPESETSNPLEEGPCVADRRALVVLCCGQGNNGGDGFVMARHLESWSVDVTVVAVGPLERCSSDAAVNRGILERSGTPLIDLSLAESSAVRDALVEEVASKLEHADWVVDALLGTGVSGPLRGHVRTLVEQINRSGKPVLAVDLPTGLDADSGLTREVAIFARETVTFVGLKTGFLTSHASRYTGRVTVLPIGLPLALERELRAKTAE